jgi:hypothetical protein
LRSASKGGCKLATKRSNSSRSSRIRVA